jgi:hypothetical protein
MAINFNMEECGVVSSIVRYSSVVRIDSQAASRASNDYPSRRNLSCFYYPVAYFKRPFQLNRRRGDIDTSAEFDPVFAACLEFLALIFELTSTKQEP